jgi:hypothetical protein
MDNIPREAGGRAGYLSYLLRLWRADEAQAGWRASLHDPRTGERLGFATLDDLVEYLRHQVDASASTGEDEMIESR